MSLTLIVQVSEVGSGVDDSVGCNVGFGIFLGVGSSVLVGSIGGLGEIPWKQCSREVLLSQEISFVVVVYTFGKTQVH